MKPAVQALATAVCFVAFSSVDADTVAEIAFPGAGSQGVFDASLERE